MLTRHFLPALLCLAALSWHPSRCAAQEGFQVSKSTTNVFESGIVTNYVILTGTSRAVFAQPANTSVEIDGRKSTIKIVPASLKNLIVLQFTTNSPVLPSEAHLPELGRSLENRFADSRVSPGPVCYTGNGPGPSFDIQRGTAFNTSLTTRIAFVPFATQGIEVSLSAASTNFPSQRYAFASFLNSLRVTPR
ncbi:MAG: hypothetical protein JWR69_4324 [Pedosphaera sp.]|nr:hypothetical protein [Pedosphaera sp.]